MLLSSIVGVNGADMAFDSLLGWCVAESDLARRWITVLPEFVPADDVCWSLADGLSGGSARWSVGVGGVILVRGVSSDALGGVRGITEILGISGFLTVWIFVSVSMDCGLGGRSSSTLRDCLKVALFLLSAVPRDPPNVVVLSEDFADARSGLVGGLARFFRDPLKTSFIFAPGDTPRPFLEVSSSA